MGLVIIETPENYFELEIQRGKIRKKSPFNCSAPIDTGVTPAWFCSICASWRATEIMSDKKRKAGAQESERPTKRPQNASVKVSYLSAPDIAKPVVGTEANILVFESND